MGLSDTCPDLYSPLWRGLTVLAWKALSQTWEKSTWSPLQVLHPSPQHIIRLLIASVHGMLSYNMIIMAQFTSPFRLWALKIWSLLNSPTSSHKLEDTHGA